MSDVKQGDVVAVIRDDGAVELVRVVRENSRRVVSYIIPGRKKPIAAKEGVVIVSVGLYQAAVTRLYERDEREFGSEAEARRIISAEADKDGGADINAIMGEI